MSFYSPYQFIPSDRLSKNLESYKDIVDGNTHIRHDRWGKRSLSGRIICKLTTKTPTMLGGPHIDQGKDQPTLVENYRVPQDGGRLAIPGNSLRGMVASVAEAISLSSMRVLDDKKDYKKFTGFNIHQYFKRLCNSDDILPWGNGKRHSLTPAEVLFGVVNKGEAEKSQDSESLATRIYFSDAFSLKESIDLLPKQKLKILSTPAENTPSPIMYFHHRDPTCSITANSISSLDAIPNGRKRYLHFSESDITDESWVSRSNKFNKNKINCHPIDTCESFYFHIDFENLKQDELGFLLSAVEPNKYAQLDETDSERFWHKIGLGKPLGLGSIDVVTLGVFIVDRHMRYRSGGLGNPRYSKSFVFNHESFKQENFAKHYPDETSFTKNPNIIPYDLWSTKLVDNESMNTLFLLGCRERMKDIPVSYPFSKTDGQQAGGEFDGFRWFMKNKDSSNMGSASSDKIPELEEGHKKTPSNQHKRNKNLRDKSSNSKKQRSKEKDDLFIKSIHLDSETDPEKWEQAFKESMLKFGEISNVKIITKKNGHRYGFASFVDKQCVDNALLSGAVSVLNRNVILTKPK